MDNFLSALRERGVPEENLIENLILCSCFVSKLKTFQTITELEIVSFDFHGIYMNKLTLKQCFCS